MVIISFLLHKEDFLEIQNFSPSIKKWPPHIERKPKLLFGCIPRLDFLEINTGGKVQFPPHSPGKYVHVCGVCCRLKE